MSSAAQTETWGETMNETAISLIINKSSWISSTHLWCDDEEEEEEDLK